MEQRIAQLESQLQTVIRENSQLVAKVKSLEDELNKAHEEIRRLKQVTNMLN